MTFARYWQACNYLEDCLSTEKTKAKLTLPMSSGLTRSCMASLSPCGTISRIGASVAEVVAQLHAVGVAADDVLLVHSSFRAVRPIEQGPAGLIEALNRSIGPRGTLVMPSWTGDDDRPFDPAATPASPDLGVVADTFGRLPLVRRWSRTVVNGAIPLPPSSAGRPLFHHPRSCQAKVNEALTTFRLFFAPA
jgi:hypothetical protein